MKLKQKLAISLCALYVVSVIGIALSMHFCSGKLASVSLYANKTSCKYCKTEPVDKKDDGCCKNTKVDVKVKDSHQVEAPVKLPKFSSLESYLPYKVVDFLKPFFVKYLSRLENKAPPRTTGISLQILHCVFRN
ncbi:hypothetical protein FA048_03065 [Pedobacter polaris]|uniref:Uncharacterized protein n=1 Tax=Pedobacter polaris TaxID=2571273 RepID=A0A4U1CUY5_9SPHI|nr:hypothetical protein [Pedobacter polaris]TKC12613.1 hypothetical protein FA048_03065 [Pedobacter polaris]